MEARLAHWKNSIKITNDLTLTGYSRAAYRTGFFVKELNIMLDAGPQCFKKPKDIFITHTHGDHIASLPLTLIGDENGNHIFNIYIPKESKEWIHSYIKSFFELNVNMKVDTSKWYNLVCMEKNMLFDVKLNKQPYRIEILDCIHPVPTVSYGFSRIKNKLKEEYKGLQGRELGKLRKSGCVITQEIVEPFFTYICDTSIEVFNANKNILKYKNIIIECTFLYEEHKERADNTQHICWVDLEPYIKNNSDIQFILIHFSLQYKDDEITEFINEQQKKYPNLKGMI
jgi:ribonuclease Z